MCPSAHTYIQLYTLYMDTGHMFYTNIIFCCIGVENKLFASQTLAPLATACRKGTISI